MSMDTETMMRETRDCATVRAILTLQHEGIPPEPTLHEIMAVALEICKVARVDFISGRRHQRYCRARQIYCYAARKLTSKATNTIGYVCGNRDHSTVIHGADRVKTNRKYFEPEVSRVMARLEGMGNG